MLTNAAKKYASYSMNTYSNVFEMFQFYYYIILGNFVLICLCNVVHVSFEQGCYVHFADYFPSFSFLFFD